MLIELSKDEINCMIKALGTVIDEHEGCQDLQAEYNLNDKLTKIYKVNEKLWERFINFEAAITFENKEEIHNMLEYCNQQDISWFMMDKATDYEDEIIKMYNENKESFCLSHCGVLCYGDIHDSTVSWHQKVPYKKLMGN